MYTAIFSIKEFTDKIQRLSTCKHDDRIENNSFPVLPPIVFAKLFPTERKQQEYDQDNNQKLPTKTYHHYLKRYHQKNSIQIVKNGQNLNLFIYPAGFQTYGGKIGRAHV